MSLIRLLYSRLTSYVAADSLFRESLNSNESDILASSRQTMSEVEGIKTLNIALMVVAAVAVISIITGIGELRSPLINNLFRDESKWVMIKDEYIIREFRCILLVKISECWVNCTRAYEEFGN